MWLHRYKLTPGESNKQKLLSPKKSKASKPPTVMSLFFAFKSIPQTLRSLYESVFEFQIISWLEMILKQERMAIRNTNR
jgi:hypothetical protein